MKSYVINLDGHAERLAWMREQLDAAGVDWVREHAVDLRGEAGLRLIEQWKDLPRSHLSVPEIGCLMSHVNLWKKIANGGDPYGCVFEDDVVISKRLGSLLKDKSWIPKRAHIVRLETAYTEIYVTKQRIAVNGTFDLCKTTNNHGGSAAYIISRKYAEKLLKMERRIGIAADLFLFSPRRLTNVYQISPAPCIQSDTYHIRMKDKSNGAPDFGTVIATASHPKETYKINLAGRAVGKAVNYAKIFFLKMEKGVIPFDGAD